MSSRLRKIRSSQAPCRPTCKSLWNNVTRNLKEWVNSKLGGRNSHGHTRELQLFEEPMKSETGLRTSSVVVPVYNSSVVLPLLVKELEAVLPKCSVDFELILVNDASPDQSWQIITKLARERAWIHGINLMRNVGQHNAVLCGIRAARYEIVATMV